MHFFIGMLHFNKLYKIKGECEYMNFDIKEKLTPISKRY